MKIIVNSGNVGTPVALELARQGHQVTLAVRTPESNAAWNKLGIHQVPFDINSLASMTAALKGGEAFFSLTPFVENLVESGTKAIQAAKQAGKNKLVNSCVARPEVLRRAWPSRTLLTPFGVPQGVPPSL